MDWPIVYNSLWVLVILIIWFVLLHNAKPKLAMNNASLNTSVANPKIFIILFILVCVLGLHRWDTYHMPLYWSNNNFEAHFEPFHIWIVENIAHDSILLYRIIVFGLTSILFISAARHLHDFTNNFVLATCLFVFDSVFCEMRGTIGVMVMMLGFIILLEQERGRLLRIIVAMVLISASYFMHRSMLLAIALSFLALIKFDKKSIIVGSWIAFPFLIPIVDALLNNVLSGVVDLSFADEMNLSSSVEAYGTQERMATNVNGIIADIITKLPIYLTFVYLSIRIGFQKIKVDKVHSFLFRMYYIMMYVGALFSFIETSSWIAIRISVMALYPLPFLISKVWEREEPGSKWVKWIVCLAIFACVFSFTYRIYLWSK